MWVTHETKICTCTVAELHVAIAIQIFAPGTRFLSGGREHSEGTSGAVAGADHYNCGVF